MRENFIRKELYCYVNKEIKSKYKTFDKAHNISHFNFVTRNCIEYGKELIKQGYDIDLEIAYIVGAYHDVGMIYGREKHALSSGKYAREDNTLKSFYDLDTIEVIAEAVEDHSSHLEYEPRSIYGKLVSDADRNNSVYLVFSRPIKFAIKNKKLTKEEIINEVYDFVDSKFGRNGYVNYWLDIPQTKKEQLDVWNLLDNKKECQMYISGIIDEVSKGKIK